MNYKHPLHSEIGSNILNDDWLNSIGCFGLRDPACSGPSRISLFIEPKKRREYLLSDVDMLIIKNGEVKILIEIEESNIGPGHLCGKALSSALSQFHIGPDDKEYRIGPSLFLQLIKTDDVKRGSKKTQQFAQIEKRLTRCLPLPESNVKEYRLIHGPLQDFRGSIGGEVRDVVKGFIEKSSQLEPHSSKDSD